MDYGWIKAIHVFVVLLWIGGIFINGLTFWAIAPKGGGLSLPRTYLLMLKKWDRYVTNAALLVVWIAGLTMAFMGSMFADRWLIAKLVLVTILSGVHGMQSANLRRICADETKIDRANRLRYSLPITIGCMLCVVGLVVVKPF